MAARSTREAQALQVIPCTLSVQSAASDLVSCGAWAAPPAPSTLRTLMITAIHVRMIASLKGAADSELEHGARIELLVGKRSVRGQLDFCLNVDSLADLSRDARRGIQPVAAAD